MKHHQHIFFAFFILAAACGSASANNLNVFNVSLTGKNTSGGVDNAANYTMVKFDIHWANSWRTSAAPNNFDAAWVFVKYRTSGGIWYHATINPSGNTAPTGTAITAIDGTGAILYRSDDDTGDFGSTGVQLRWNYGADEVHDNADIEIQVFALEMVYVPTGAFTLGSGGVDEGGFYRSPTSPTTYHVASEDAIAVGTSNGELYYDNSSEGTGDHAGPIPGEFPKGFKAFFCMKYEISQQGYVDFLNSLTYQEQIAHTPIAPNAPAGTYLYNTHRNKINVLTSGIDNTVSAVYATDAPNVACNYLSWTDLAAYLDWSGLRPMTELEFEKACRGTLPAVADEHVWGTPVIFGGEYTIKNSGGDDEQIDANYCTIPGDGNAAYALTTTSPGAIDGPVRVGIFAGTSANTGRVSSGATYYGIMEMGGNVWERPVTIGTAAGRSFTGSHGDGFVDGAGIADVFTWPGVDADGAGFRGGSVDQYSENLRTSWRRNAADVNTAREFSFGGRGVRSAPSYYLTPDPLMLPVSGGTFTAGSTEVTISSFQIDKFEVTFEKWTEVAAWGATHGYTDLPAGQNGSIIAGTAASGANNPVTRVNWYDILKWCNARSEKEGKTPVYTTSSDLTVVYRTGPGNPDDLTPASVKWTSNGYRLPTEAEWEFAASGGTLHNSPLYIYSGSDNLGNVAWNIWNSEGTSHPVGTMYFHNELGTYDMSGNVWEWCWDWHDDSNDYPSGGVVDPRGPSTTQTGRVLRGGSFNDGFDACRTVNRFNDDPAYRGNLNGFRCVQN